MQMLWLVTAGVGWGWLLIAPYASGGQDSLVEVMIGDLTNTGSVDQLHDSGGGQGGHCIPFIPVRRIKCLSPPLCPFVEVKDGRMNLMRSLARRLFLFRR